MGQDTTQIEKVVETLADTKEVEEIKSNQKITVIEDDKSDNEKVKDSSATQDQQNLNVNDSTRSVTDYKSDSSVSEDEEENKKEKKKMRRESSESSSDDKSVSSSSESNAERQKNKVQETLLDEEKDEKKI